MWEVQVLDLALWASPVAASSHPSPLAPSDQPPATACNTVTYMRWYHACMHITYMQHTIHRPLHSPQPFLPAHPCPGQVAQVQSLLSNLGLGSFGGTLGFNLSLRSRVPWSSDDKSVRQSRLLLEPSNFLTFCPPSIFPAFSSLASLKVSVCRVNAIYASLGENEAPCTDLSYVL